MTSEVHHRHPLHGEDAPQQQHQLHEASPLLFVKHLSMEEEEDNHHQHPSHKGSHAVEAAHTTFRLFGIFCTLVILVTGIFLAVDHSSSSHQTSSSSSSTTSTPSHPPNIVPIEEAQEHWVTIPPNDDDETTMLTPLRIWYRTWGNRESGLPILFVHGGPGNAIADYHNGNRRFFSDADFWVIEVDQRGTGNSQPSVRDNYRNMQIYRNISIDAIVSDFEVVRQQLGIEQWMVWGGSFGSTLTINYATRYPERCLALILRGIYLDTAQEVHDVYARETYVHNAKRLAEYDTLLAYAQSHTQETLDPNNARHLLEVYAQLIESGDKYAIWHWHVFENNLMETDPANLLDPDEIDHRHFAEAQSVAFFETRLWLHGSWEAPSNLLSRIQQLVGFPIWICQGQFDEVCPPRYAQRLADALQDVGAEYTMRSIPSGHEQTDPVMARCLEKSLQEFLEETAAGES